MEFNLFEHRKQVGEKLENIMKIKGLTKVELCKATEVSRPTLDKILSGDISSANTYNKHMEKILKYLGLDGETIMYGSKFDMPHIFRTFARQSRYGIDDIAHMTGIDPKKLEGDMENLSEAELRDVATVLGTSVLSLKGEDCFAPQSVTPEDLLERKNSRFDELSGFYGYLGLNLLGQDETLWYPINNDVYAQMYSGLGDDLYYVVPCLNNKLLIINTESVKSYKLLADDVQEPYTWGEHASDFYEVPEEVFNVLEELYAYEVDEKSLKGRYSEKLIKMSKAVVKEQGWTASEIESITTGATVIYKDGSSDGHHVLDLSDIALDVEFIYNGMNSDGHSHIFSFLGDAEEDICIMGRNLALLELPLAIVNREICRNRREILDELER